MTDDGISTCHICGYQWLRGHNGSHVCSEVLEKKLETILEQFEELYKNCKALVDPDCIYGVCDLEDDLRDAEALFRDSHEKK